MSIKWLSDLCGCVSYMQIIEGEPVGDLINPCSHHLTFSKCLEDNRKKNIFLGNIESLIEPSDEKYITFQFDENHDLYFIPHGYNEEEIDILNYTWSN